jgi:hypothetical protein
LQNIQLSKNVFTPAAERLPAGGRRENVLRLSFFGAQFAPPKKLVENTGLEPVTSWLQTRRSPS